MCSCMLETFEIKYLSSPTFCNRDIRYNVLPMMLYSLWNDVASLTFWVVNLFKIIFHYLNHYKSIIFFTYCLVCPFCYHLTSPSILSCFSQTSQFHYYYKHWRPSLCQYQFLSCMWMVPLRRTRCQPMMLACIPLFKTLIEFLSLHYLGTLIQSSYPLLQW